MDIGLTLPVLIPDEERKLNQNFYFHTSLWCPKRFYEGLKTEVFFECLLVVDYLILSDWFQHASLLFGIFTMRFFYFLGFQFLRIAL